MTDTEIRMTDEEHIKSMEQRREHQHKTNEKFQSKTKTVIDKQVLKPGDVVMHRDLPNFDKPRDTFVVVSQEADMVTVRKMTNQLRMKTYEVRSEKLVLVFTPEKTKKAKI